MQTPINVEALMSQLSQRETIRDDFKLPMDAAGAQLLITEMMRQRVEKGRRQYLPESQREIVATVARFLTTPTPRFGLMFMGLCGNGKTTLVKALQTLLWHLMLRDDYGNKLLLKVHTAKELAQLYAAETSPHQAELFRTPLLAIDDLGHEPHEMMSYGNVLTPLTDILEMRYERRLFTIVTTNLTPEQVRSIYGVRIADRFNEMMEPVVFTAPSFR